MHLIGRGRCSLHQFSVFSDRAATADVHTTARLKRTCGSLTCPPVQDLSLRLNTDDDRKWTRELLMYQWEDTKHPTRRLRSRGPAGGNIFRPRLYFQNFRNTILNRSLLCQLEIRQCIYHLAFRLDCLQEPRSLSWSQISWEYAAPMMLWETRSSEWFQVRSCPCRPGSTLPSHRMPL